MQDLLARLVKGERLTEQQAFDVFDQILEGDSNEVQMGAMLALIAARDPTVDEIVGAARAMRARAEKVDVERHLDEPEPDGRRRVLLDTCGTGGAPKTFNISTAAAFVAAAAKGRARVLVAKHGGKSRSGRGSADILRALGVNVDAPPEVEARCLAEVGVCFTFAVNHHPAMRYAAGPRRSLGFPTIFNLLGPLTNPAGANRQLMGVYAERFVAPVGEALRRLGAENAWVVHGRDGMDEITTTATTKVANVDRDGVRIEEYDARELGVEKASLEDLQQADTLEAAANLFRRVLEGERGPARDVVLVNAAAALMVAGACADMPEGFALAKEAVDEGRAKAALEMLAKLSNEKA